ncbi:hypothetical protein ACFY4K_17180 [Streptomyces leeuwenhoekii]|jgi:hypothetical protein|uniref:hypothetical protein n=1 Tax=Streptomyces leeuwenhoekii TaxID=1437453 RepID=UPI0036B6BAF1
MPQPPDPAAPPETPSRPCRPEARGLDGITDLIRWAAFSCVLVPVVLLWFGTSLAGAAGTALGLAAVTGACRLLLRRSERCAAPPPAGHGHTAPGARGGGRRGRGSAPVD